MIYELNCECLYVYVCVFELGRNIVLLEALPGVFYV